MLSVKCSVFLHGHLRKSLAVFEAGAGSLGDLSYKKVRENNYRKDSYNGKTTD